MGTGKRSKTFERQERRYGVTGRAHKRTPSCSSTLDWSSSHGASASEAGKSSSSGIVGYHVIGKVVGNPISDSERVVSVIPFRIDLCCLRQ